MIRLAPPDLGKEEFEAVRQVLESGNLVQGEKVDQFESKMAEYLGAKYAVAVSRGTAGQIHLGCWLF